MKCAKAIKRHGIFVWMKLCVVRLVKYSHIISYFGRHLFGDESWCCWCSRHLSHSLGFSHWNAMNLLELKLFACFNAQSLLNVIASISKTFKHIIREWMHNPSRNRNRNTIGSTSRHSNQSMHQLRGLLENAQFICHFSLQLPEEFRHSNIIVPFLPFLRFSCILFVRRFAFLFIFSGFSYSIRYFFSYANTTETGVYLPPYIDILLFWISSKYMRIHNRISIQIHVVYGVFFLVL